MAKFAKQSSSEKQDGRARLLTAALSVIRMKGYTATSVDELCAAAGVTKGAFFHHFKSKDDLAVAAVEHWTETTGAFFAAAPYNAHPDPLDRVLAYIDFRKSIIQGEVPEFTCLVGTIVQEAYATRPDVRDACAESIFGHASTLALDIAQAKAVRVIEGDWTAEDLAQHTQAVIQGAFILAKAKNSRTPALESLNHLRRYIELLFGVASSAFPASRRDLTQ